MLDKIFFPILNMSLMASYVMLFVLLARLFLKKAPKIFSYALWSVVFFRLLCPFSFESKVSFMPSGVPIITVPPSDSAATVAVATIGESAVNLTPSISTSDILTVIWLVGIAALTIYSVVSLVLLRYKLVGAVKQNDNIYLVDHLQSPFVLGMICPKIYLPSTLLPDEQSYIILHEQTHIKRFDHIIKTLTFCTLCVHWFNPLVWLAFVLCVKDMEMSCDESVMKQMGTDIRKEYSASLLSLATGKKIIAGTPLAFGEGDMKGRIKNVMNYKKPAFWVVAISVVAVVAVGIGLMANPKSSTNSYWGTSAKDVLNKYTLALEASDLAGMRQLMPALNPPIQDYIDAWKEIKISDITVLQEDIRENKAEFELLVTVKSAPDGFGMWTPGTATHYLYAERCDDGWYVESYGAGGRSESDLDVWWSQPNLIGSATAFDLKPMLMLDGNLYLDTGKEEPMGASIAIDGEILSTVEQTKKPAENGQSNFGFVGSNYCIDEHGVVVQINDKWIRFKKDATPAEQTNNTASDKSAQEVIASLPENLTMLDVGVWPNNEYTNSIPKPESGTVLRGWIDPEKKYCYIQFSDINQVKSEAYIKKLKENGFEEVQMTSEKIKNEGYISVGTVLSNGETTVSIAYTNDLFALYISPSDSNKIDVP